MSQNALKKEDFYGCPGCRRKIKIKKDNLTSTQAHHTRKIRHAACPSCNIVYLEKIFTDPFGAYLKPVTLQGKKAQRELDKLIDEKIDKALIWRTPKKNDPMVGVTYHKEGNRMRLNDTIEGEAKTRSIFWIKGIKFISYKDIFRTKAFQNFITNIA